MNRNFPKVVGSEQGTGEGILSLFNLGVRFDESIGSEKIDLRSSLPSSLVGLELLETLELSPSSL